MSRNVLARPGRWFTPMTAGARRAIAFLIALGLVIGGGVLVFGAREVSSLRSQQAELRSQQHALNVQERRLGRAQRSLCQEHRDIGDAPLTPNPATGKPSKLGVSILVDFRVAWRGLGCPGQLAPPSPELQHWARAYKLPAP